MEELGFAPSEPLEALFKMEPTADNGHEFAMVYSVVYTGPFVAAEDEIDELDWFTFDQVDEWVAKLAKDNSAPGLTGGFIEIWNRYRAGGACS